MSGWDKASAQALQILGDGSEVPPLSDPMMKADKAFGEAQTAFNTSREACEGKLLELDNANSAWLNSAHQFRAKIEKNDFKLDGKKDAKKIQQARKILLGMLDEGMQALQRNDKKLDELDKHMIQLGAYKQAKGPG